MSNLIYKEPFLKDCVRGTRTPFAPYDLFLNSECKDRWKERFWDFKTPKFIENGQGRRLNNFLIGSDPEFMFANPSGSTVIHAVNVGLKVGIAAGMDQNERLVELRPWPSTSVVEHLASILSTLRWLYRVYSTSRNLTWRAGAFFAGDGIGGHIHFGRKRPTRDKETQGLDGLALILAKSGLFPLGEWQRRMHGDERHQFYGQFGDTRPQLHGYEYRTLPSWLDSPLNAFVTLTASKLVVLDPEVTIPWAVKAVEEGFENNRLLALAKLYMNRDDDARLLYHILLQQRNFQYIGGDFKARWGLNADILVTVPVEDYILPASIKAQPEEVKEIQNFLQNGVLLGFRESPSNFTHHVPEHYEWLPNRITLSRRAGFGDLIHNMVHHRDHQIQIEYYNDRSRCMVSPDLWNRWNKREQVRFQNELNGSVCKDWNGLLIVGISKQNCQVPMIKATRSILLDSGMFPIWKVDQVTPNSYTKWHQAHSIKNSKMKTKGKDL